MVDFLTNLFDIVVFNVFNAAFRANRWMVILSMQKVVHMMVDFFTSLSDIVVFNIYLNTVFDFIKLILQA